MAIVARKSRVPVARDARPPLIVHVILRLDFGGMENGLVNLLNHMPAERYRHAIVCLKDYTSFRQRIRRGDVEVYALDKRDGKDFGCYLRLWRLLRRLQPAVVHSRNLGTIDTVFVSACAGVRHRVHGLHGWDMEDLRGTSPKYTLLRRLCSPLISRYIAVSRELQQWIVGQLGLRQHRVAQIYNGVDAQRFRPARAGEPVRDVLPESFRGAGRVVFGTVGRLERVKDQATIARAFVDLIEREPQLRERVRLVVVGSGTLLEEITNILRAGGAEDLCWLCGMRDDVPQLMRALDVFILSSINEGISNTILEAMASGLAVIATDVGGNPELVEPGVTGRLVEPAAPQAMAQLMAQYAHQPALTGAHGDAARQRVQSRFSLDAMVGGYVGVYDELLGRGRVLATN